MVKGLGLGFRLRVKSLGERLHFWNEHAVRTLYVVGVQILLGASRQEGKKISLTI